MEEKVKIKNGRFKGDNFRIEGLIKDICGDDCLPSLACKGNFAANNALEIDKYTVDDEPFYYGKIGSLGYIISSNDLGIKVKNI